ncbi:erythrocyte membrane protein 1, EMP1, exon 2, partial [Plasmodium reichenowi]
MSGRTNLFRVIFISQNVYYIFTTKSSNKYVPYECGRYKRKTYIYKEGEETENYSYICDISFSDITSSSQRDYEELYINNIYIYIPRSPKYKTLIEVVLEPSKRDIPSGDMPSDDAAPSNKLTEDEWNTLKDDFISGILENTQKDLPKNNISANTPMNIQPNTLYFDNPEEKPFIMSIHDRNLLSAEEYNYDMSTNSGKNDLYSGIDPTSSNHGPYSGKNGPISGKNDVYSGIDLINDSLSADHDIYDELLKRKENELFGTNHTKNTSNNSVAKNTNSDPIMNQLYLLHKWLDRHRNMCENWENHHERLAKLKEEWNKDNNKHNGENNINKFLNTNPSIQTDMDNPKLINQYSNMDTNVDTPTMDNMEDDIYYDVNDDDNQPSVDDIPMDHNRVDVPKKVHVEMKILNNISKSSLEQQFPISDVWNI